MTWKQTISRVAPVCLLLAGCTAGKPVTTTDHVTIGKGQSVEPYQLVNVDPQGRAEFRYYPDFNSGLPPFFAAPGQKFGGTFEVKGKPKTLYEFEVQSTDPAKQQATVISKVTTGK